MNDDTKYLADVLGLKATCSIWPDANNLPLFLKSNMQVLLMETAWGPFLLARVDAPSLPDTKRVYTQLSKRASLPIVMSVPYADARQRKALLAQGIPFVCAGKQAFLPFLGLASTEWGNRKASVCRQQKMSAGAQQAAIWGALRKTAYTPAELRAATGMSASRASEAVSELVERGLAERTKSGRSVTITGVSLDELLEEHMAELRTPVERMLLVKCCGATSSLPDAGETALSGKTMRGLPRIDQKAASRAMRKTLYTHEVLEGEVPDEQTVEVQFWRYGPLFAESKEVDIISLALSLAAKKDERIDAEIDELFGRVYAWHKAQ